MADSAFRSQWLDAAGSPLIDQHAQRLTTFVDAIADGRIDEAELTSQEQRVVELMKEVEPQIPAALRDKVTSLLCELTAYDMMQMLHTMQQARPRTQFRG